MTQVWVTSEGKAVLLGTMPFNRGFCANSSWVAPEFYFSKLVGVRILPYMAKDIIKLKLS